MSHGEWTDKRPMSPHVSVWRWHVTMLGSILHRATGVANYVGALAVVGWLFAAASGEDAYAVFEKCAASPLGLIVLFGFTLSIVYHLLNGVRHLVLDAGAGFNPKGASITSALVLALSVLAAAAIWLAGGLVPGVSL